MSKPPALYHRTRLCEISLNHIIYVAAEMVAHLASERIEVPVDVNRLSLEIRNEMHRTNCIVQRQLPEIRRSRPTGGIDVVYLHAGVEAAAACVLRAHALYIGKKSLHIVGIHVARRGKGYRAVRRKAVVFHTARHGGPCHSIHIGTAVAILRVAVKVISVGLRYYFSEVHIV